MRFRFALLRWLFCCYACAVVSLSLSTGFRPALVLCAWPFSRGWLRLFLCMAPRVGVGFGRLRIRAGGFVCLSSFGPRLVLGLVAPRGVGFSLSRFGLVLVVCAVVSFIAPSFGAWCWFRKAKSRKYALYTVRV